MMLATNRVHIIAKSKSSSLLRIKRQPSIVCVRTSSAASGGKLRIDDAKTAKSTSTKTSNRFSARNLAMFGSGVAVGGLIGSQYTGSQQAQAHHLHYPSGMPRSCSCEEQEDSSKHVSLRNLTVSQKELPQKLKKIVGKENVLDGSKETIRTTPFLKGMRLGHGQALCVVTPRRVKDVYEILPHILDANCVILPQGQNTGLTGGSTPRHESADDRPMVVLSLKHLDTIAPVDDGKRVLCLAGVGLGSLERFLERHFPDREPHSVLGSTFLNPTTAAGIAYGSGGTQCFRKGPAYTERALYLKISQNKWKENVVEIVNTLGIKKLGDSPAIVGQETKFNNAVYKLDAYSETIKRGFKQKQCFSDPTSPHGEAAASDIDYGKKLCKLDSSVARFNADTHGPDCNRSEGKVIILATVHDTFPKPKTTKTFWIGFESLDLALEFRKAVTLDNADDLPVSAEYVDRDAFDVIDEAGRVMANIIRVAGTTSPLVRTMWNAKTFVESLPFASAPVLIDKLLYATNPIFPSVLPNEVRKTGTSMNHHVALTVGDFGDGGMDRLLQRLHTFASKHGPEKVVIHECSEPKDAARLDAFRFVAAPAFRTWCVGQRVQGFSVDYALPKEGGAAPPLEGVKPLKRMRYSHFGCNVVHEDLAYDAGVDLHEAKHSLKHTVEEQCRGKLPAEHGHGTEYTAPAETRARWEEMDPLNVLNPGVGGLSCKREYANEET